ncbi:MAG: Lipopolysaccharide biosynthesis protein [Verrucomicrobiales bacterium]|nr:Lipopolysaccharide biosynthesis protein [Verrucomicrobiales bacterium]
MQPTPKSNPTVPAPSSSGIRPEDILFILFRHKWKIVICTLAGLVAAACLYSVKHPIYQADAKVLLRYVVERKSVGPVTGDSQVQSPDARGDNLISSELEILSSLDLAITVAEAVGPEKILAKIGGGNDRVKAALVIKKGLVADVPRGNIIRLVFRHEDPTVLQPVLQKLIESYLKKHIEIHRSAFASEFLAGQQIDFRNKLNRTENELLNLRTSLGVISTEDLKSFSTRKLKILEELSTALAEYEQKAAPLREYQALTSSKTNAASSEAGVPAEKIEAYKALVEDWNSLNAKLATLVSKHTDDYEPVQQVRVALSMAEKRKKEMEAKEPKLLSLNIPSAQGGTQANEMASLLSQARALEAKMNSYSNQLAQIRSDELAFAKAQSQIEQLQRQKELEEANYKYYSTALEQSQVDNALGDGKISNIKVVQEPSPPARETSVELKPVKNVAVGGIVLGLALAFLLEMVLSQTIKRPSEIESKLHWPLFLSIPYKNGTVPGLAESLRHRASKFLFWKKDRHSARRLSRPSDLTSETSDQSSSDLTSAFPAVTPEIAPWDNHNKFHSYFEQIRDRLILHFEARNLTRKPKLIAVTSCSSGAGVSTIAVGLAASLSQTGDGNVLLVDLNSERGAAHPFYNGKPGCGLPDVFEKEKRDSAMVQENLYVVKGSGSNGNAATFLPKNLADLMPKIKASDYDYIIFDMPPIVQSSVMLRLAGHMDMVLMILESEKTPRSIARRASVLLQEAKANVVTILNKRKNYIPGWLHSDT